MTYVATRLGRQTAIGSIESININDDRKPAAGVFRAEKGEKAAMAEGRCRFRARGSDLQGSDSDPRFHNPNPVLFPAR